jgi:hypothetical protein
MQFIKTAIFDQAGTIPRSSAVLLELIERIENSVMK